MPFLRALVMALLVGLGCWLTAWTPAAAQSLATFTSEASYTAALPAAGVTTTVESFASVTTNRPVSTGTPDQWNGFTLVAQGTSEFGSSSYCASLRACMNWTASPPTLPGIYGAVSDPSLGNGRLTFAPAARALGFGLEYWDWNDGSQRSQIVVTLSNGAVFNVTGPTTNSGDPGGFIGFRIDDASVAAGITITSVAWVAFSGNSEIIGMRNVRVSAVNPLVVTNTNDSGAGSLRNAIDFANSLSSPSTVSFAIPGAGPHSITLASSLPQITANGLLIDGASQPGAQCRDLWAGSGHDLRINLRGPGLFGPSLRGANQVIRGLSITEFRFGLDLGADSTAAAVQCSYIGLRPDGSAAGNTERGIRIYGSGAVVGGLNSGEGNVMSANGVAVITQSGSSDTAIRGNFIGTDPTGMTPRANTLRGINNQSGSSTWRDITGNLISGNLGPGGIALEFDDQVSPSTDVIRIQRNVIGFNRDQSALMRNSGSGILFPSASISNVLIGGNATTQGNQIASNGDGIFVEGATNISIQGNVVARSQGTGIVLRGTTTGAIGGTSQDLANLIGGNAANGIVLDGGSSGIMVLGNTIGTATIAGSTANNGSHGIWMNGASSITIGNGTAGGRNVIGGNGGRAIMGTRTTSDIAINGNYIGTDASGNVAVTNGASSGLVVRDAISFVQGGTFSNIAISNNVIGGYQAALVELWSSTATGVTIQGNSLGVGADGVSPIISGNIEELIHIGGATPGAYSNVLIGGAAVGEGNILANGGRGGVFLFSNGTNIQVIGNTIRNNAAQGIRVINPTRVAIISNRIFANGGLGIDLNDDGVTPNDPGDGDSGPNDLLNFPQNIRAIVTSANQLGYSFIFDAPAATQGYRIEFFASSATNPSGFAEGERYLGAVDIAHAGGAQNYAGTLTTLAPVSIGEAVTATATRRTGSGAWDISSEFSAIATADGVAALSVAMTTELLEPAAAQAFFIPGNDVLLSATISNNGNGSTDPDSVFVAIAIDPANAFHNGVTPVLGGVTGFESGAPSLTFTPATDLRFSDAATAPTSFAQCTYTPVAGYDPQVRHVCLNPKGSLPSGAPQGQFTVRLRARIN